MDSNICGGRFPVDTIGVTISFDTDNKIKEINLVTTDLHSQLILRVRTIKGVEEV